MPRKKIKSIFYLALIFALLITIRFLFFKANDTIFVSADTYGYYSVGQKMLSNKIFVDDTRPPIYPLFINLPSFFQQNIDIEILSQQFFKNMETVILAQSILAIASIILLYRLLLFIGIKPIYTYLYIIFIGSNIMIFANERILMAESLTTSWLIVITYVIISRLKKMDLITFILLFILFLIGFSLKPVYILLPILLFTIFNIHQRNKYMIYSSFIIMILFASIIYIYISANSKHYQYRGISRASDYNMLGKILVNNLNIDSAKGSFLYTKITEYRQLDKEPMPYRLMEYIEPYYYLNKSLVDQIPEFNRKIITSNLTFYLWKSIIDIPQAQLEPNLSITYYTSNDNYLSKLFQYLYQIYHLAQYATLITLPGYLLIFYQFIKKPRFKSTVWVIIGGIAVYQIIMSVFFSYGEFGRLISVALPWIYLFSFYCWVKFGKWLLNISYKYPSRQK